MTTLKELRVRKKGLTSIFRMTSAMKMISQVKFNRAKTQLKETAEICNSLKRLVSHLLLYKQHDGHASEDHSIPYLSQNNPGKPWLLVLFSSDSGLCGGFNQHLINEAVRWAQGISGPPPQVVCVGQKAASYLKRHSNLEMIDIFTQLHDDASSVLELILSLFNHGHIEGCSFLFAHYVNVLRQDPCLIPFLPLHIEAYTEGELLGEGLPYFSPSLDQALQEGLHLLLLSEFSRVFKEHRLSEHGARMSAMDAATDSAKTMMESLRLSYNHLRQDMITRELVEIISGSEAMK